MESKEILDRLKSRGITLTVQDDTSKETKPTVAYHPEKKLLFLNSTHLNTIRVQEYSILYFLFLYDNEYPYVKNLDNGWKLVANLPMDSTSIYSNAAHEYASKHRFRPWSKPTEPETRTHYHPVRPLRKQPSFGSSLLGVMTLGLLGDDDPFNIDD